MKEILVFLLICATVYGSAIRNLEPRFGGRIIDGENADIKDVPYQVALLYRTSQRCGGSIISKNWVLTAAHCTQGLAAASLKIRAGSNSWDNGGSLHQVIKNIVHPKYNTDILYDFDYALLKVEEPFELGTPGVDKIEPASLDPQDGEIALIAGWGQTWNRDLQLKKVTIPVVAREKCQKSYRPLGMTISDRMMCAGWPEGGRNTCYGDSGGPLVVAGKQVGIVSWASGCATRGYPTVFGDVADQREWIRENTGV